MTAEHLSGADDALFDQAAGWFFRLGADDVTAAERQAFAAWLDQSADHCAVWDEVQALYAALEEPARALYHQDMGTAKPRRAKGRRRWAWAFGLCCGGLAMGVGLFQGPGVVDRLRADYATAIGQRQTVALDDGSRISLNTDTALTVQYGDHRRVITLLRGEAYFEVAPDKMRPFQVRTDQGSVTAVGTAFAVRQDAEGTALVVTEGVVAVQGAQTGPEAVSVPHGQSLHFTAQTIDPPQATAAGSVLAWREGKAVFRQQPFGQVIGELDRYWPGLTVVVDHGLAVEPVSGVVDLDRREASLNALAVLLGAEVTEITPYLALIHRP
jgi:transmembrane sensor